MNGQRRLRRAHGPDVQIMQAGDARQVLQIAAHIDDADTLWHGIHGHIQRFPQQAPGAPNDRCGDEQACDRIDPGPAGQEQHGAGNHDPGRDGGVRRQMRKGASDIQIVPPPGHQQPGRQAVDDNGDAGNDHDRQSVRMLRIAETQDRFPCNRAGCDQEQDGIDQSRKDRGRSKSVSESLGRRGAAQEIRAPGQDQA